MGSEISHYRPAPYTSESGGANYESFRESREDARTKVLKKNYLNFVRKAAVSRDDFLFGFLKRIDLFAHLQNVSLKGRFSKPHHDELLGFHGNPYETMLGEMNGTMIKITHQMYLPTADYGDRPLHLNELDLKDMRPYGNTNFFHEHLDTSNTAKNANPQ